ncbi:MAG: hypothetical protein ABEJ56_06505 [Candidatus Nanohaloarchaea archaeon]
MVAPERVDRKLADIEEYLQKLEEKKDVSEQEFLEDPDIQDIVERRFEKIIHQYRPGIPPSLVRRFKRTGRLRRPFQGTFRGRNTRL